MFDHFGILAPFYETFIKAERPDALIKLADLPIEGALLDVGGGTGRVSQFFTDLAPKVIVADLSLKMLVETQQKDHLLAAASHSEKLPFPDQTFERIIMVDALHHVCDQQLTADELWRVLKPDGKIIIEEPNFNLWFIKILALAEKLALMRSHFLSPEKIKALFDPFPAKTSIADQGYISRVIVTKPKDPKTITI